MCGICGKLYFEKNRNVDPDLIDRMIGSIKHRGPDGDGKYVNKSIGLGHARLSIIDLESGLQPICNEDRTIWLVYNGEIYNFPELRKQLIENGHIFKSSTDSEVIVHLYEEMGVDCVSKLRGMFAFAIWDEKNERLFCARDRVGIKPFYYSLDNQMFTFSSELKAFLSEKTFRRSINHQAIDSLFAFSYIPKEDTLFDNVKKLLPGQRLIIENSNVIIENYWDLIFRNNKENKNINRASEELIDLVETRVEDHLISDVPVGVLLSGGIDSTIILDCVSRYSKKKVQTFTVGFRGEEFEDERMYASLAARKYNTDHRSITISAQEFVDYLPNYIWHMEEPVYEAPAVALHYVSELASKHVKVVLSGEGADEAFGGYQNYTHLTRLEKLKTVFGEFTSGMLSDIMCFSSKIGTLQKLDRYAQLMKVPISSYYFSRRATPYSSLSKQREILFSNELKSHIDSNYTNSIIANLFSKVKSDEILNQMLYIDTKTWLPDDLLVKADKMTMANSIELRVPFLDHTLLEYSASLPVNYKIMGNNRKRILKHAFKNRIPHEIINRKKVGFKVPIENWLRNELSDFVRETLTSKKALDRGYFEKKELFKLLSDYKEDSSTVQIIFTLLALEIWHQKFIDL